jgi:hypothetical protein
VRALAGVLAVAIALVGAARGQAGAPPAKPAAEPVPPRSDDAAWADVEKDFFSAWQLHQASIQRAQQEGLPPESWPPSPVNDFWEVCVPFANRGTIGAIRWCIAYSDGLALQPEARKAVRVELYRAWTKDMPEGAGLREVVRSLQSEVHPSRLGVPAASALCGAIADRVQDRRLRGAARLAQGSMILSGGTPADLERARPLITRGIEDDPEGELVATLRGRLFQIDNLRVGKPCPDFTATDVDGVAFKRSDYLGKVVVLDFWGFW